MQQSLLNPQYFVDLTQYLSNFKLPQRKVCSNFINFPKIHPTIS